VKSGLRNQLTKQVGEYLVASELARRGLLVATFSGNVPDPDLIATDGRGFSLPLQVKTATAGSWHFKITRFVGITFEGEHQIIGDKKPLIIQNLVYVFVIAATQYGSDEFFILDEASLQGKLIDNYGGYLKKYGSRRPKQPSSLHASMTRSGIKQYKDDWDTITSYFLPTS
jgi:hypothetical protein